MGLLDMAPPAATKGLAALLILCLGGLFVATCVTAPADAVMAADQEEALKALVPGDIAWMLVSTALVLIMTPGLAFFYGGMARHDTMVSTIMQCFTPMAIVPVLWALVGFSFAFGESIPGFAGILGSPADFGLMRNVGAAPNAALAATIPLTVFFLFQLVFAVITPSIIVGSIADRANAPALCLFVGLWHLVLYCPLAHMVWHPSGLIRTFGVLDFAGGTVVHMSAGYAALVAAWYLGKPLRFEEGHLFSLKEPSNVPTVVLGTALLWFGWFGFNAGSAAAANATAAQAFLTTNSATAVAMLVWMLMDHLRGLKMRATGACVGAVIGLVAITPAAGFVNVGSAMLIGLIGAVVCALVQEAMERWGRKYVDDTLDVWAAHGVGGTVGMICTSLFATTSVNSAGADGAFYGNGLLLGKTLLVLVIIVPWFLVFTYGCLFVTDKVMRLRASDIEIMQGLDISKHGERASAAVPLEVYQASIHGSAHGGTAYANGNGNGTANV